MTNETYFHSTHTSHGQLANVICDSLLKLSDECSNVPFEDHCVSTSGTIDCPDDKGFVAMALAIDHNNHMLIAIEGFPIDKPVDRWLKRLNARITFCEKGSRVDIDIKPESAKLIKVLASKVRHVAGPKKGQSLHQHKRTCHNMSVLLVEVATALGRFQRLRPHPISSSGSSNGGLPTRELLESVATKELRGLEESMLERRQACPEKWAVTGIRKAARSDSWDALVCIKEKCASKAEALAFITAYRALPKTQQRAKDLRAEAYEGDRWEYTGDRCRVCARLTLLRQWTEFAKQFACSFGPVVTLGEFDFKVGKTGELRRGMHAWIEVDDKVLDCGRFVITPTWWPKDEFYETFNVKHILDESYDDVICAVDEESV